MALVTHKFKLDLTPGAARQVLYTSQGDIGRPFEADLYWNGSPWTATGTTANIRGKKPDDTVFDYTATVSGTAVTFETTEQMTIISGPVECELVFSQSGDVIASANFVLIVEDSPYDPNNLSESEVEGLTDVLAGFQRLNRDSNGVVKIGDGVTASGTAEPIKGFYVHDEESNTDGVAKIDIDGVDGLSNNLNNVKQRNYSDFAPIDSNFKNEILSYSNGNIPAQYIGQNLGYTDESFYLTSQFISFSIPSGLRVIVAFYSDTSESSFVTGMEKTEDFELAAYRYKYFRYCVRKTSNSSTITIDEAKTVTLTSYNKYYSDLQRLWVLNEISDNFVLTGGTFLSQDLKAGKITSTGVLEGSRYGRYYEYFIPTRNINAVSVPDDYSVNVYYYDSDYSYVTMATKSQDFKPSENYEYCRLNLVKYVNGNLAEFNDSLELFDAFRVYVNVSDVINAVTEGDLLPLPAATKTNNGITYEFANGKFRISGTASAYSTDVLFSNDNAFPNGFKRGHKYYVVFDGLPSRLNMSIYHKTANGWVSNESDRLVPSGSYNSYFTIPDDAIGLKIQISVNQSYTVDHTTEMHIYDCASATYAAKVKERKTTPMLSIVYDDGLTKFKDYILPIVESKKIPLSTSIIVSAIEEGSQNVMSYNDIKECYEKGVEVLVHSKERSELEWGSNVETVSHELRVAKHLLNVKACPVPDCYIFSASSALYPVCRQATKNEFLCGFTSGSQGSVAANNNVTNYANTTDPYYIKRRWADANWTSGETNAEEILKSWIDELVEEGDGWQVWTRHNYSADEEPANAQILSNVIDYALANGVQIVTIERGLKEYII